MGQEWHQVRATIVLLQNKQHAIPALSFRLIHDWCEATWKPFRESFINALKSRSPCTLKTWSKINSRCHEIHYYSYNGSPSWFQKPTHLSRRIARKTTQHTYNTVINSSLERDCNGNCQASIRTSSLRMYNIDRYWCLQSTSEGYVHEKTLF